jgi:histidinol-phosphatase (PHP family)
MLDAAVSVGYHSFGVSEHVPRVEERFLYPNEIELGWDIPKLQSDFAHYTLCLQELAEEFEGRLNVLRGLEMEIVPEARYIPLMQDWRNQLRADGAPAFDYAVGSVHHLHEISIDGPPEMFQEIVALSGSVEETAILYYKKVAEMAQALKPEVVSHLDLVKRNLVLAGFGEERLDTSRIAKAAEEALESVKSVNAILDLNTAGWRKGLGEPYPAPWLVKRAHAMGIGFCFGDDSHRPSDVGAGVDDARAYLLTHGVPTVTVLRRVGRIAEATVVQRVVPL